MSPGARAGLRAGDESRAGHGYRNELSWQVGRGRQPYTNQETGAPQAAGAFVECAQGDRGSHSGVTQQQMHELQRKP